MALIIAFLSKGVGCFLGSYLLRIHLQNIAVSYFPKVSMGCLVFCLFGVTLRKKINRKLHSHEHCGLVYLKTCPFGFYEILCSGLSLLTFESDVYHQCWNEKSKQIKIGIHGYSNLYISFHTTKTITALHDFIIIQIAMLPFVYSGNRYQHVSTQITVEAQA